MSACRATAQENAACWPRLTAGFPFYEDYQARTARELPVIVLSGATDEFPPPVGSERA